MKKIFIISSMLLSTLIADNFLGTPITSSNGTIKPINQDKSYSKNIDNPPLQKKSKSYKKFRKDDHRYDKRYSNFDYETYGYYSDDNYYYGYYDERGYFYNNIFFTYNSRYTYYDRHHHRGYFRPSYPHHRIYEYHVINDWNRVHCYREPHEVVYGYYYEHPSYNSYGSSYYENRHRHYEHPYPSYRRGSGRISTHRVHHNSHRDYNNHNYRGDTRMRIRNSNNRDSVDRRARDKSSGSAHMQLSR